MNSTVGLSYSENFDAIIALLTHLSNCDQESRTVPHMATNLGLDAEIVRKVLDGFPGFFRRSKKRDAVNEPYYTVHMRYARRKVDGESSPTERLTADELGSLFDLVSKMVSNEHEMLKTNLSLKAQTDSMIRNSNIMIAVAVLSAIVAIVTCVVNVKYSGDSAPAAQMTQASNKP
jgi:hypothetical protein